MSVLIKGMEMPISCDSCRIMVLEDTNCDPELFCGCPLVFKAHPQGEDRRPDYCPLVELPPHGRLIDADSLKVKAIERSEKCGAYVNVLDKVITAYDIETAPTIIPAEEAEQ